MVFRLRFWGVRGSIPCPAATHIGFGGNTSCVQVDVGDQTLILDAGTGMRELGNRMLASQDSNKKKATLLLSHAHWDHICGIPFFAPFFSDEHEFDIMAGSLHHVGGVRSALRDQMAEPLFPIPIDAFQAKLNFIDFRAGETLQLGSGVEVKTAPLNHVGGATGYRIEHAGRSICYVTDTEHIPGKPDESVLELIDQADLVIYDSTYTDAEFPDRIGWGHSTWEEGIRLCKQAGAKRLMIFHHDPSHDDDFMSQVEDHARTEWAGASVARERMVIDMLARPSYSGIPAIDRP